MAVLGCCLLSQLQKAQKECTHRNAHHYCRGRARRWADPSLNSALGCFLCVRTHVFLVSPNGGISFLEQVLHYWLQDPHPQAIVLLCCYFQMTPSVVVPYDGFESRLAKPRTLRADSIIHGRSPGIKSPYIISGHSRQTLSAIEVWGYQRNKPRNCSH